MYGSHFNLIAFGVTSNIVREMATEWAHQLPSNLTRRTFHKLTMELLKLIGLGWDILGFQTFVLVPHRHLDIAGMDILISIKMLFSLAFTLSPIC